MARLVEDLPQLRRHSLTLHLSPDSIKVVSYLAWKASLAHRESLIENFLLFGRQLRSRWSCRCRFRRPVMMARWRW